MEKYDNEETSKITFVALNWMLHEMLNIGILQRDPNEYNNMLVYRTAGENNSEGWYSQNIMSAASELYEDKEQLDFVISAAKDAGIDVTNLPN